MSSDPFEDPATATPMPYPDLVGSLLLFFVLSYEEHIPTAFTEPGKKSPAVRANVIIIDGPKAGQRMAEVLVFPKKLQAQLRPRLGKMVLGRLAIGEARKGQNAPWELEPATPQDKAAAQQAIAAHTGQAPAPGSSYEAPAQPPTPAPAAAPSSGEPPF